MNYYHCISCNNFLVEQDGSWNVVDFSLVPRGSDASLVEQSGDGEFKDFTCPICIVEQNTIVE